jgi:coproporphyrinogen III oxidase
MSSPFVHPQSRLATQASELVQFLQTRMVERLKALDKSVQFSRLEWHRDQGRHGGGCRYVAESPKVFNRASINISQVHYDDEPNKKLGSATALSTIIHPENPHIPSLHLHISWTEMKHGQGYWRIMADLNPSLPSKLGPDFSQVFLECVPELSEEGFRQGDQYFYIPALKCHRGICHFYLESYHSGDFEQDLHLAQNIGEAVIDFYSGVFHNTLEVKKLISEEDRHQQLNYHTLYFFQVLTLDRGTTSGLLIHNQNDQGILGSLPSHIDRELLKSWLGFMPKPQDQLLLNILEVLPTINPCPIAENLKPNLAEILRQHYQKYPAALDLQARADIVPPTVPNHL